MLKKLVVFCPTNGFKVPLLSKPAISRILFYSYYSTQQTKTPPPPMKAATRDKLYNRISSVGNPRVSIVPILDQWVQQGKIVDRDELNSMIKKLKLFKRFKHALEISQWMSDRRFIVLSPGDIAIKLALISRVHGTEQAEKYFNSIPKQSKFFPIYFALLNCYAHRKSIEKAEPLMQQMRELGFARSPLPYNIMLNLYSRVGQYEKLDTLMNEMNEKGVQWDSFTFCIRLTAYADTSKFDGIEKILLRMEVDPMIAMDWNCYAIAANGYIKAGMIDKALETLKKSEELISGKKRRHAYDFLLTLYAAAESKEDLHRIWNLYKSSEKVYNSAYKRMISSLLKLNDTAGAEKILEEWERRDTFYDFQVPNQLIAAYCKNGLVEKAEMFVRKAIEKGKKPFPKTWGILATGYVKANLIPKAVEAIKAGFLGRRPGWKPTRDTLAACLVYLKEQGDAEKTEEFVRLLGAPGHVSTNDCERLLDYIYGSKTEVEVDGDGWDDDEETDEIAKHIWSNETDEIAEHIWNNETDEIEKHIWSNFAP